MRKPPKILATSEETCPLDKRLFKRGYQRTGKPIGQGDCPREDAWEQKHPLDKARVPDRREYGFGKLHYGMAFGQKSHPTYGIRGAIAQCDVVKATGLIPNRDDTPDANIELPKAKLMLADTCIGGEDLVGKVVTTAHSGKRFYIDSLCYDMTAENSFPRKEGYLGPLEYSSYVDYYKQKYSPLHL
ncbi:hypothetical protein Cgig2_008472 [Carnegiea gigantea]|uniref:PAZ domain-containing protein n=1 Tax=Carnegiea gigantea TaxID=171969 RepID=A0A9Q1JUB5_9CARY|nr:hypothetical protein Cgig2_008472 [Carnegiea gigantea]